MARFHEYGQFDGIGLSKLIRSGQITAVEVIEEAIQRIEDANPELNAVIHTMFDTALAAASSQEREYSGPLAMVPFLLKDLLAAYANEPLRHGSRSYAQFVPDHHSELVKRYQDAGLIALGKTNTPEFGLAPVTEPKLFGPTRNPWNKTHTPGGSSGGSAAAVAARLVPIAHGNDGAGSIRIPASCCGLFGLKPSRGRTPLGPDLGKVWHGMICHHVLTRTVRDSAAALDLVTEHTIGYPYFPGEQTPSYLDLVKRPPRRLKIAFSDLPFNGSRFDHNCVTAMQAMVSLCHELGHDVQEATLPIDDADFLSAFITIVCSEVRTQIIEAKEALGRSSRFSDFEYATWLTGVIGNRFSAVDYSSAMRTFHQISENAVDFFREYDVFITPTLAAPPLELGEFDPTNLEEMVLKFLGRTGSFRLSYLLGVVDEIADRLLGYISYLPVFNVTGQPAMSVPALWTDDGLPIGVHFAARYGDEETLFRLAAQIEEAQPWINRIPEM